MHLTGHGFQATGKIWCLQNRIKYGYLDITAPGEDGYQGTGDKIITRRSLLQGLQIFE